VVLASQKWWETLTSSERKLIQNTLRDTMDWSYRRQAKMEVDNLAALIADGVIVTELSNSTSLGNAQQVRDIFLKKDPLIAKFYNELMDAKDRKGCLSSTPTKQSGAGELIC